MRKYSGESGIPHPEHLRGTQLRQHIATQSAMMDLREHEVDDLANFMGHAEKIHREHYQIPVVTRDIGRISQLLEMGVGDFNQDCFKNRDSTIDKSMLQKRKNDTEKSSKDHFSNESDEQNEGIVSAKISGRTEPREMSNVSWGPRDSAKSETDYRVCRLVNVVSSEIVALRIVHRNTTHFFIKISAIKSEKMRMPKDHMTLQPKNPVTFISRGDQ
ncbi:hypothetical protein JTB14_011639 [Gonioctena quinquepunctata]|nr:hypothetical protein JTB14_011639 [Gonioctena quinquepunctata]